ncbi:MAG TPA: glycerol kinase GlpK [Acidimicrobiales bacterium]|nr:glycerol kinase GlpK [Acidimicrobiales bacterium]
MAAVLAVDAGTTGVRTLAVDESGAIVAIAHRPLSLRFPHPGWVEQDPEEIWALAAETLADVATRLAAHHQTIAAIGIANQRETAVAWDRRTGRPLHAAIVWQDRRTAARCEALADAGLLPLVRERTGLVLDPYFSATKFEWLLGEGGVGTGDDVALGTVDAWLLFRLTGGALHATDASNASRTMLFDIGSREWTAELCDVLGVPVDALPAVMPTCGRFGRLARGGDGPGAIEALAGVPISGVAGDQQAALFGQACVVPGMAKVTYGTGSFLLVHAGSSCPAPPDGLLATVAWDLGGHESRPGHADVAYALEGSTFVAGAAIQWLRDGLRVIERAEDVGPLAGSVPDSGGMVVVPAFTGLGSPWWDPHARGIVTGITRGAGRAQLARAVVEAMAFGVRDMLDAVVDALGTTVPHLRADGGASAMELLLQLQADQLQLPVVRPRCVESTALGAAMLAGLAEGVWGGVDELAARWEPDVECVPAVGRELADLAHGAWRRAVERARDWA